MSLSVKDDEWLKKYKKIWKKVENSIKKEFHSEPVYNKKYLKANIKSYNGKINTNFDNNKIPRENSQCIFLSAILIYSNFIILNCFQKNLNMLLKKKRFLSIILTT